eukprot:5351719-Lingulodinium_polyedra.AAC.1
MAVDEVAERERERLPRPTRPSPPAGGANDGQAARAPSQGHQAAATAAPRAQPGSGPAPRAQPEPP